MTLATHFPTSAAVVTAVKEALRKGNVDTANRLVSEFFRRVRREPAHIHAEVLRQPSSTGDVRYDTLLAVGLAYAPTTWGLPTEPWMEMVPALSEEWVWDSEGASAPEFLEYIHHQTPPSSWREVCSCVIEMFALSDLHREPAA